MADINGDGKADLLIPNALPQGQSGCQTAVTLGNGDGTFGPIINVPPSDFTHSVHFSRPTTR